MGLLVELEKEGLIYKTQSKEKLISPMVWQWMGEYEK